MLGNYTFQVKVVKDAPTQGQIPPYHRMPEATVAKGSEEQIVNVAQEVALIAAGAYSFCKSVDFLFRLAEHKITS